MNGQETEDLLAALRMADEYRVAAVRHLQTELAGIQAGLDLVGIWLRAHQADADGVAEQLGLTRRDQPGDLRPVYSIQPTHSQSAVGSVV